MKPIKFPTLLRSIACLFLVTQFFCCAGCTKLSGLGGSFLTPSQVSGKLNPVEMQFGLARLSERSRSLEEAVEGYHNVLKLNQNHPGALHRLGVISMKQGQPEKATQYFEESISAAEPNVDLLGDFGYALYLQSEFENAREYLEMANQLKPGDQRIVNNLGLAIGMLGDFQDAYDLFRSVNTDGEAHANLGFVHAQLGHWDDAKQSFHRALDIDPELQMAANGLVEIHRRQQSHAPPSTDARGVVGNDNSVSPMVRLTASPVENADVGSAAK